MSTTIEDIKGRYIGPNAHYRERAYCDYIVILEAENARLQGRACLICGRDAPCELDTNKDNDPNWPGSPCTFDPSPVEAAKRFMEQRDRLQEQVKEAETCAKWSGDIVKEAESERDRALGELVASISKGHKWDEMYDKVIDERDRLQERVKEAEEEIGLLDNGNAVWLQLGERLIRERDGYKAQSEQRRKALRKALQWMDAVISEPDKALISRNLGHLIMRDVRAALAPCATCGGTRVVSDADLGGDGTNSACPDCGEEK